MLGGLSIFVGFVMRFGMLLIVSRMFMRNGVNLILMFGFFVITIYSLLTPTYLYSPISQYPYNTFPPLPPTP